MCTTRLQMQLAPFYVNQFTYGGRVKRVYIQADAPFRMDIDAFQHLYTPSLFTNGTGSTSTAASQSSSSSTTAANGFTTPVDPSPANTSISPYNMVPLSSVVNANWSFGPTVLPRYNGYSAIEIVGNSARGLFDRTGDRCAAEHRRPSVAHGFRGGLDRAVVPGIAVGLIGDDLLMLSIVVVFLCLAALYESWSIPAAVLLVVPLGMLGMLVFCLSFGVPNDIYFKIGLVTVIGLAAKNAILIVEFAVEGQQRGMTLRDAVLTAARLRLRPILMTSAAFILGVFPLVVSSGAGAASRHEIGTGVIGGMLFATCLRFAADSGVLCGRAATAGRQARRGIEEDAASRWRRRWRKRSRSARRRQTRRRRRTLAAARAAQVLQGRAQPA